MEGGASYAFTSLQASGETVSWRRVAFRRVAALEGAALVEQDLYGCLFSIVGLAVIAGVVYLLSLL